MNRSLLGPLAILFTLKIATLTGCSDECTELADLGCSKAGEQSDECKKLRQRADSANNDDKRICAKALSVVNAFTAK